MAAPRMMSRIGQQQPGESQRQHHPTDAKKHDPDTDVKRGEVGAFEGAVVIGFLVGHRLVQANTARGGCPSPAGLGDLDHELLDVVVVIDTHNIIL
jgi:hypothetical protein